MVFSSAIFLFAFLPALIVLYFCTPRILKNTLLLAASLLFYAWGEGIYLLLMLASIVLNYGFGIAIEYYRPQRLWLALGVVLNLGLLVSFKYANFLADNINVALGFFGISEISLAPVHLPLGISFFTFQALSYLIDISRGQIKSQKNPLNLGLYLSLFPQLIAGPIVRYTTIVDDILNRRESLNQFTQGVERFTFGLAKKMLIANPLGLVADTIFALPAGEIPMTVAWVGVACYALQIYFDFSGYSDMAIGLGKMFGFRFLENFNYPYAAQSLQEFWRRWHISLSTWFRDYLYIPLGGNQVSPIRIYVNLFSVFLLCGLWHGASWNFLIWGALHGAFLTLERVGLGRFLKKLWPPLRHAYLMFVVLVTWVFFRADTLSDSLDYLNAMFSINKRPIPFDFIDVISTEVILAATAGLILMTPVFRRLRLGQSGRWETHSNKYTLSISAAVLILCLLSLSIIKLSSTTHNPFIYFRF